MDALIQYVGDFFSSFEEPVTVLRLGLILGNSFIDQSGDICGICVKTGYLCHTGQA